MTAPAKRKTPVSLDDPSVVTELLERIASGKAIKEACREKGMPHFVTVFRRMNTDPEFAALMARAHEQQQDALVDEMREIADSATPETVHVAKLRIWQRQWVAMKLAPKKYGERTQVEHSGSIGLTHYLRELGKPSKVTQLPPMLDEPERDD